MDAHRPGLFRDVARDIRLSDLAAGISALVFVVTLLVLGSWGG